MFSGMINFVCSLPTPKKHFGTLKWNEEEIFLAHSQNFEIILYMTFRKGMVTTIAGIQVFNFWNKGNVFEINGI